MAGSTISSHVTIGVTLGSGSYPSPLTITQAGAIAASGYSATALIATISDGYVLNAGTIGGSGGSLGAAGTLRRRWWRGRRVRRGRPDQRWRDHGWDRRHRGRRWPWRRWGGWLDRQHHQQRHNQRGNGGGGGGVDGTGGDGGICVHRRAAASTNVGVVTGGTGHSGGYGGMGGDGALLDARRPDQYRHDPWRHRWRQHRAYINSPAAAVTG